MKRALLLLILFVPGAWAHAEPFQSEPAGGSRLDIAPEVVWVDFTEPIFRDGSWIRVVDQGGDRVDNDDLVVTGTRQPRMQVSLSDIPDGAYSIQWQTYSQSDGHTIRGSIGFAVGGFAPPPTTEDAEAEFDLFPALARAVLYAGISLGIGGLLYTRFVGPTASKWAIAGAGAAFTGTLLLAYDSWQETGIALGQYARGPGGIDFLWRLGLAALATALAYRYRAWPLWVVWAAFTWMTASFGHVTREGLWAIGLEWLHLIAAATWVGGLFYFLLSLREGTGHGARFTQVAQWAVAGLVASGLTITAVLVWPLRGELGLLWSDSWTWFLVTKITAVVLMLVLATLNRYVFIDADNPLGRWVTRVRPDFTRPGGLRRSVQLEAGLSVVTILAAGLLLSVSPPTEGLEQDPILERTAQGDAFVALMRVTPTPALGQSHELRFFISDSSGDPLTNNTCGRDDCLRMRWVVDGNASTEQEAALVAEGDGWWKVEDVLFIRAGQTEVTLAVQSAYVYLDELTFEPFTV